VFRKEVLHKVGCERVNKKVDKMRLRMKNIEASVVEEEFAYSDLE
jgi:hypothetical protein